jgi:uncharacterized repeat protein (TIGR01451 family)
LVEILTEELLAGGTVAIGEAARRAKLRYFLESPGLDAYDEKTMQQWTLFGLPMYAVKTRAAGSSTLRAASAVAGERSDGAAGDRAQERPAVEALGGATVTRRFSGTAGAETVGAPGPAGASLPPHVTRLDLHFDLSAPGVYTKRNALGDVITAPGCPPPVSGEPGCYYTLNGLVERATGGADVPLQPYLIYDSRLGGTSQHGVLWMGGTFVEEPGWVPVFGELASNLDPEGPDPSEHGSTPRRSMIRPIAPRVVPGVDPAECRPSDTELNSLVITAGEALKQEVGDPVYDRERTYRAIDLEVLYFNNTADGSGNCDRTGPALAPGPFAGSAYHQAVGTTVEWAVPPGDADGFWRVVVVVQDGVLDENGVGHWVPVELADDGGGTFRGSLTVSGSNRLSYVLEAVDHHGNVTWLDFVPVVPPASGVEPPIVETVDVPLDLGSADLAVAIVDSPDPVNAGQPLNYAVRVDNFGPDPAVELTLTAVLPAGTSYLGFVGAQWACGEIGGTVTCTKGALAAGTSSTVTLFLEAPAAGGSIQGSATVTTLSEDLVGANDTDSETTTVLTTPGVDLAIAQDVGPVPAMPGEAVTYELTVTNAGPQAANGAFLSDDFPAALANVEWTCVPSGGASCSPGGSGDLALTISVPASASLVVTASGTLDAAASGMLTNTANVFAPAGTNDTDPTDNTTTSVIPIGLAIFGSGFESGDFNGWGGVEPPP